MVVDIRVGVDMQPDRGRSSIKYYRIIKFIFLNRKQASGSRAQGGGRNAAFVPNLGEVGCTASHSNNACLCLNSPVPSYAARPSAA
jgi:hypothetical protein